MKKLDRTFGVEIELGLDQELSTQDFKAEFEPHYVEETNQYNRKTEINKITWYFSSKGKKDFDIRSFSVRMYFKVVMMQVNLS